MKKDKIELGTLKLVGLTARTNNKNEMDPNKGKIGPLANAYWEKQLSNQILHRSTPGKTYAVYTEFVNKEKGEEGDYTYFIGEHVDSFDDQDLTKFKTLTIKPNTYQKFTTAPGPMPIVVINAWQEIWQMGKTDFSGSRNYIADFEVYDQRAADFNNAIIDIYIGIK